VFPYDDCVTAAWLFDYTTAFSNEPFRIRSDKEVMMFDAPSGPSMLRRVVVSVLGMLGASTVFVAVTLLLVTIVIDRAAPSARDARQPDTLKAVTHPQSSDPAPERPGRSGGTPRSPSHEQSSWPVSGPVG
jgi:hypothetical protein